MKYFYILIFGILFSIPLQAQNFKFGKVSKKEIAEQVHPLDENADAAVLYQEQKTFYEWIQNRGFSLVTEVHERVKIYSKEGLDYANKKIRHAHNSSGKEEITNIKGYTYNLVGNKVEDTKLRNEGVFEEEVDDYWMKTTLTMPAVKVGSVVEYKYTVRSPFLYYMDDIALQNDIPIDKLELDVRVPEYFGFKPHFNLRSPLRFNLEHNTTIKRQNVTQDTWERASVDFFEYEENHYTLSLEDIPALESEPYVDYLRNYLAYLKWEILYIKIPNKPLENFAKTWEAVAKTIYDEDGYKNELKRSGYFEEELDPLLRGKKEPEEKMALIYNFVKDKVKWNNYYGYTTKEGCRKAFKEGIGNVADINLMLTAMLQYAGLQANPVLVSSPENGIPVYPTRRGFNYVISRVSLPSGDYFLDATDETAAPGELPERARNWQGRVVRANGDSQWINLVPSSKSREVSTINLQINEDFSLIGKFRSINDGLFAKELRDEFKDVDSIAHIKKIESGKGDIKVSGWVVEGLETTGTKVTESYDFEMNRAVEVINNNIYLKPLMFLARQENPFKAAERKFPIFFDYPKSINSTVNIMIPEGYEVSFLPEDSIVQLNGGTGTYKFIVNQNGNFLRVQTVLDLNTILFTPTDYAALKKFYDHMVKKETETIILKKA